MIPPSDRKSKLWSVIVSWQSGSQQVAVMFAALVGVVLSSALPPENMASWGVACSFAPGLRDHSVPLQAQAISPRDG